MEKEEEDMQNFAGLGGESSWQDRSHISNFFTSLILRLLPRAARRALMHFFQALSPPPSFEPSGLLLFFGEIG